MKTLRNIFVVGIMTLVIYTCKTETQPELRTVSTESAAVESKLDPNATYAKAEFIIEGMSCEIGCARTIEKKLAKMEGVKSAKVDFDNKLAMVEYDEARVNTNSLEETVKKTGEVYTVKEMRTVDSFEAKKSCSADCDKACCKDKTEAEIKACKAECKKVCCAKKV